MGSIISFFTVLAIAAILIPAALGMQVFRFLQANAVVVSIVIWALLAIFAYFVGRKECKKEDQFAMYCFPSVFLPSYILLFSTLDSLVSTSGFEILLLPIMVFLSLCFTMLVGLGVWAVCTKIRKPELALVTTIIAEILASAWVMSI